MTQFRKRPLPLRLGTLPSFLSQILQKKFMITYTHKGWFGICPIYLGDINGDCNVTARSDYLEWLMDVSEALIGFGIYVKSRLNPDYEPMFPLCVTGELATPVVRSR